MKDRKTKFPTKVTNIIINLPLKIKEKEENKKNKFNFNLYKHTNTNEFQTFDKKKKKKENKELKFKIDNPVNQKFLPISNIYIYWTPHTHTHTHAWMDKYLFQFLAKYYTRG